MTKLDSKMLTGLDVVKAEAEALLEAAGGPLPAVEIAARINRPVRDVVNALCDGVLFRRVSRGVYGLKNDGVREVTP